MNEQDEKQRFIEKYLPVNELGTFAEAEGRIGKGRIANVHRWWARRRQGLVRGLIFSCLVPYSKINHKEFSELIKKLGNYYAEDDTRTIQYALQKIKEYNTVNDNITLWDPFSGGGAIPLEAMRMGLKIYASDLNPMACLILNATLDYPERFGMKQVFGMDSAVSNLGDLIREWGKWVADKAYDEILPLFCIEGQEPPAAVFWVHTIPCSNPACGKTMPLSKMTYMLREKGEKKGGWLLELLPNHNTGKFNGKVTFIPKIGTQDLKRITGSRGASTCIFCNQSTSGEKIREMAQNGLMGYSQVAKMYINRSTGRRIGIKTFTSTTAEDEELVNKAEQMDKNSQLGFIPIPNYGRGRQGDYGSPRIYGITSYKDFFIPRQRVVYEIFGNWIQKAYIEIQRKKDKETARIITLYLSFALISFLEFSSRYSLWVEDGRPKQVALNLAYNITWDFPEIYPLKEGGFSFLSKIDDIANAVDGISKIKPNAMKIWQHDATQRSELDDLSIDLIFTDPPYYATLDYAGLADFHYGLHRSILQSIFPSYFRDLVTPKAQECLLQENRYANLEEATKAYEEQLLNAFREMNRVLKSDGLMVVVFAHIELSAWAAIISALLAANFQITACWPINTESTSGAIQGRDALTATMHMVCRKKNNSMKKVVIQDILRDLDLELQTSFKELWNLGFTGSNLDIAMLGPAFKFFGKFEVIEDEKTGEKVDISRWMDIIRKKVIQMQFQQIMTDFLPAELSSSLKSIDVFTQFYILFRLEYGIKPVETDAVRLLEKATNLNLTDLVRWGYLKKNQGKIELLHAEQRINPEDIINNIVESRLLSLIDTLHGAILAHERGIFEEYAKRNNITPEHPIWSAAQLISSIIPANSREASNLKNLLNVRKIRNAAEFKPLISDIKRNT